MIIKRISGKTRNRKDYNIPVRKFGAIKRKDGEFGELKMNDELKNLNNWEAKAKFWRLCFAVLVALLLLWRALPQHPDSHRDAVARIMPSVVGIYGGRPSARAADNIGAGVAVDGRHIITNYHLIANMSRIEADINGEIRAAELAGVDPEIDIALLRVPGAKLRPAAFAADSDLRRGDIVFAVGNPFGLGRSASMGIVSAVGRNLADTPHHENFIQTDAAINPGSSGGALANAHGELVGINSALFARTPEDGNAQGIGFAVPADIISRSLKDFLPQQPAATTPFGAEVRPMSARMHRKVLDFVPDSTPVMLVSRVWDGTPAAKMDLRIGDIVLEIDDSPASGLSENSALPPSLQSIVVLRGGERLRLQLGD